MNERVLRYRDLRVIGADGEQVGILQSRQALAMAKESGLDLVVVSPQAQPPVAKIIDYGKFKYQTEKREKESKRKQQDVKGIKMRPGTAAHDFEVLVKNATKFLNEGDKVRVVCQFRAREVTHPEIGQRKLLALAERLADISTVERTPTLDGKAMVMVLLPKAPRQPQAKKNNAKDSNEQDSGQAVQDNGVGQDHSAEVGE